MRFCCAWAVVVLVISPLVLGRSYGTQRFRGVLESDLPSLRTRYDESREGNIHRKRMMLETNMLLKSLLRSMKREGSTAASSFLQMYQARRRGDIWPCNEKDERARCDSIRSSCRKEGSPNSEERNRRDEDLPVSDARRRSNSYIETGPGAALLETFATTYRKDKSNIISPRGGTVENILKSMLSKAMDTHEELSDIEDTLQRLPSKMKSVAVRPTIIRKRPERTVEEDFVEPEEIIFDDASEEDTQDSSGESESEDLHVAEETDQEVLASEKSDEGTSDRDADSAEESVDATSEVDPEIEELASTLVLPDPQELNLESVVPQEDVAEFDIPLGDEKTADMDMNLTPTMHDETQNFFDFPPVPESDDASMMPNTIGSSVPETEFMG